MSGTRILGILLLVAGLAVLVVGGVSYTSTETLVDVGPVEVEAKEEKAVPVEPIVAGLAVVGGIALLGLRREN